MNSKIAKIRKLLEMAQNWGFENLPYNQSKNFKNNFFSLGQTSNICYAYLIVISQINKFYW
jgi:hypothetical protein